MKLSRKSQLPSMLLCILIAACTSNSQTTQPSVTLSIIATQTPAATAGPNPRTTSTVMLITVPPSVSPTSSQELSIDSLTGWKIYQNDPFGLNFQFPSTWLGPDVYVQDGIRIEVGSDKVYPYGTDQLQRIYEIKNSYYVTIQYWKNNNNLTLEQYTENQPWIKTHLSLLNLKDGESLSGQRALVTRVRKLKIGRFEGLEYIETLSETAQTEITYTRRIVLFDEHLNTLHISGTPNNVEIINKDSWRDAYRKVDEANRDTFYKILESITVQ
jgi:hypothetical protein